MARWIRRASSTGRARLAARVLVTGVVLVAVVARVGTGPFLHGLLSVDLRVVAAAFALSAVATVAAAWRWSVIAARLGVGVPLPRAVGLYYRSQFVNTVLPGGVLGDVDRAVAQGRGAGNVPQAARAVVIERTMGQLVQVGLAVVVVAWFGREFEGYLLPAIAVGVAVLLVAVGAAAATSARVRRALRRELDELHAGVGSPDALVRVIMASIVVVACHVTTFGIAVAAVGADVPPPRVAALALVVLLAGSIPLNVGGWGPREGIAAWAFAVAGLGGATGVAASTLFGIVAMIAVAPGLVLALRPAWRRPGAGARPDAAGPTTVAAGIAATAIATAVVADREDAE